MVPAPASVQSAEASRDESLAKILPGFCTNFSTMVLKTITYEDETSQIVMEKGRCEAAWVKGCDSTIVPGDKSALRENYPATSSSNFWSMSKLE